MTAEINSIRKSFEEYIILQDISHKQAAALVGWKTGPSVTKFLAGKHVPNKRRLFRIKHLLERG